MSSNCELRVASPPHYQLVRLLLRAGCLQLAGPPRNSPKSGAAGSWLPQQDTVNNLLRFRILPTSRSPPSIEIGVSVVRDGLLRGAQRLFCLTVATSAYSESVHPICLFLVFVRKAMDGPRLIFFLALSLLTSVPMNTPNQADSPIATTLTGYRLRGDNYQFYGATAHNYLESCP